MSFSISSITIFIQILLLPFIAVLNLLINKKCKRKNINFYSILLALVLNNAVWIPHIINDINKEITIFSISNGTFIIIDLIYFLGLILLIFSKNEFDEFESDKISDCLLLIIISNFIGMIVTLNLIALISCFLTITILLGIIFFTGEYKKEFNILKFYFISIIFIVIFLAFSIIIIFFESNTLLLNEIDSFQLSEISNILISLFLILGISIPFGILPFSIYHLRNYFQNSSYTQLFLYSLFNYISMFSLIRILKLFTFSLIFNGFIIFSLSSVSLIISLFYIITELFTNFDGKTYSIKKIFGYSIMSDYNLFLLLFSILSFMNIENNTFYFESLIFFMFINMFSKFLVFYTLYPVTLETYEDNLRILGDFWKKYKLFGIALFISGICFIVPLGLSGIFNLLYINTLNEFNMNSLLKLIGTLTFSLFMLYLFTSLTFISTFFTRIYFKNNVEYLERKNIKEMSINYFFPILVFYALIITYIIVFVLNNNILFELFRDFFIIAEL
ncbi:MAG: proton-conducting transporter membrane subunit [Promethearchaeota archaeon]